MGEGFAIDLIERREIVHVRQEACRFHNIDVYKRQVVSRQDGKWTHYRLNEEGIEHAVRRLSFLTGRKTDEM